MNMDAERKDIKKMLDNLEELIKFSFQHRLNIHSSVGAKYGELYVAHELFYHDPLLGDWRRKSKSVKQRRTSTDIILERTKKKIEVKWAMLHHKPDDYYVKSRGYEFWGWGFGERGTQFTEKRFDYCVLLAAKKDEAEPAYIFVLKCEEMKDDKAFKPRVSGEAGKNKTSFFLQYSEDPAFYEKNENNKHRIYANAIEKDFRDNYEKHKSRWKALIDKGKLDD